MGTGLSVPVGGTTAVSIRAGILRRKLTPKKPGSQSVWMYVMHIENFTLTPPPADIVAQSNAENPDRPLFDKPIVVNDYYVPVALIPEGSDRIMKFGTYESYVPAGAFMCKLLEYISQCDPTLKRCSRNYAYVGGRYTGIQGYLRPSAAPKAVDAAASPSAQAYDHLAATLDAVRRRDTAVPHEAPADPTYAEQAAAQAAAAAAATAAALDKANASAAQTDAKVAASAAARAARNNGGGGKRRRHKTPRRRRKVRKSTFRRHRKH